MKSKKYRIVVTMPAQTLFYDTNKDKEVDEIVGVARRSSNPLLIAVYSKNEDGGYSQIFSETNRRIGF